MYKKLTVIEKKSVREKIKLLESDMSHPSLRSKKLNGNLDVYESSVNMDIRLLWRYQDGSIILLLAVGHHDILKKY
jgi:mRNA-degrading endonuclease YafQ of YafQ-DinJ toxin-antitoxin module